MDRGKSTHTHIMLKLDQDSTISTTLEVELESQTPTPTTNRNCCLHPCCTHFCCFKCTNEKSTFYKGAALVCFSPLSFYSVVAWLLLLVLMLNIFCFASTSSVFYPSVELPETENALNTVVVGVLYIAITLCAFAAYYRATLVPIIKRRELPPQCKSCCFKLLTGLLIYLLPTPLLLNVSQAMIFPGTVYDFENYHYNFNNSTEHWERGKEMTDESVGGMSFYFTSKYDGAKIRGFKKVLGNQSSSSSPPIPIVVLGGNGGSGWTNPRVAERYTELKRNGSKALFEVYSYSYRGYVPNDALIISEQAVIGDSESMFEHVAGLYPGQRPILLSWSIGTGPAAALMKFFSADDIACVGFSMPFTTVHQLANELANYFPMLYIWLIPEWNSVERITHADSEVPTMILSGGVDHLISPHQQLEIYEASPANDKNLLYSPTMGHG